MSPEAIGGIFGGVLAGFFSGGLAARYQAKAQIETMRIETQGLRDQLDAKRAHAREDREQEAAAAAQQADEEARQALRLAASELAAAVRDPDSMRVNLRRAQKESRAAAARIPAGSPLRAIADRLVRAATEKDDDLAQAVVAEAGSAD